MWRTRQFYRSSKRTWYGMYFWLRTVCFTSPVFIFPSEALRIVLEISLPIGYQWGSCKWINTANSRPIPSLNRSGNWLAFLIILSVPGAIVSRPKWIQLSKSHAMSINKYSWTKLNYLELFLHFDEGVCYCAQGPVQNDVCNWFFL